MESSLSQINTIMQMSAYGPLIASALGIIVSVVRGEPQQTISRLPYLGRVLLVLLGIAVLNFLISGLFGPSESSMQQLRFDEIIPRLWVVAIGSIVTAFVGGYLLGRFTIGRSKDMGRPKSFALLVIFSPAILYFLFAPPRLMSEPTTNSTLG